jgi:hypothetical protein
MPTAKDLLSLLANTQESKKHHDHRLYSQRLIEEGHRLESVIRNALAEGNHDRIAKIVHQLCHDYAYAVHQPHARNGGLIGLAAAAIALGAVRATDTEMRHAARLTCPGSRPLLEGDRATRAGLLFRPGCACAVLCVREHV